MLIDAKLLCALKLFAGQKDARYYLNGIYWEGDKMIATCGSMLAVAQVPESAPTPVIIPNEAFSLVKPNSGTVEVTAERVGALAFTPIDGKYPDWRRILPVWPSGETAQFDPDLVAALGKAGKLLRGFPRIAHNGTGAAVVRFGERVDVAAVIMPRNVEAARKKGAPPLEWCAPGWAFK